MKIRKICYILLLCCGQGSERRPQEEERLGGEEPQVHPPVLQAPDLLLPLQGLHLVSQVLLPSIFNPPISMCLIAYWIKLQKSALPKLSSQKAKSIISQIILWKVFKKLNYIKYMYNKHINIMYYIICFIIIYLYYIAMCNEKLDDLHLPCFSLKIVCCNNMTMFTIRVISRGLDS